MKTKLLFIIAFGLFFSCSNDQEKETKIEITKVPAVIPEEDMFDYDTLSGMYIGDFGGSDIRIILNYVSSSNAIGYNIHKGLTRNITGKVSQRGDTIHMSLAEPGDHEFDGVFDLEFIGIDINPKGSWTPNSKELRAKSIELTKMVADESSDDEQITPHNFTRFYSFVYDSIGHYYFEKDGLCRYEYYPSDNNEDKSDQMVIVNGSWSLTDSIVSIDWQPNKRFTNRKMIFITKRGEYDMPYLEGEGLELHNYWW